MLWNEIANSAGFTNFIKFDLEIARRCEIGDEVLMPTIAMRKFQIQKYAERYPTSKIEEYFDRMAKKDAVEILQGDASDINALLTRSVKIYSKIFDEAGAKKYIAMLVFSALAPYNSLDLDAYESILPRLDKASQDYVDINTILCRLYTNNHEKQDELIYGIVTNLMRNSCQWKKEPYGYQKSCQVALEEFANHPVVIKCAGILGKDALKFADEIASTPYPLAMSEHLRSVSPEVASPGVLHQPLVQVDLLTGDDYAFYAPPSSQLAGESYASSVEVKEP